MEKIRIPILLSSLYLLVYTLSTVVPVHLVIPLTLFSLSPIIVIWMVYKVLKDGEESTLTFDEAFYEDHPYRRVGTPQNKLNKSIKHQEKV
jgi:hypothetical protein